VPELPEVETVRRGLEPVMSGQIIAKADVRRPDLRWPFPERMAARLTGARIERLGRRAKYILADLDRGETLIIHLGMSGRMTIQGEGLGVFHQRFWPGLDRNHWAMLLMRPILRRLSRVSGLLSKLLFWISGSFLVLAIFMYARRCGVRESLPKGWQVESVVQRLIR